MGDWFSTDWYFISEIIFPLINMQVATYVLLLWGMIKDCTCICVCVCMCVCVCIYIYIYTAHIYSAQLHSLMFYLTVPSVARSVRWLFNDELADHRRAVSIWSLSWPDIEAGTLRTEVSRPSVARTHTIRGYEGRGGVSSVAMFYV